MDLLSHRRNKNSVFNKNQKPNSRIELTHYILNGCAKDEIPDPHVVMMLHNNIPVVITKESVFNDYSVISVLGKGTYAQVWKVKSKDSDSVYAAKLLQPSQFPKESFNRIIEMFAKEIINLAICQCPGVIKLHKVIGGKEGWLLIQDFADDGTLWKENLTSSMNEAFIYFVQLLQGMMFIQDMDILHRDLKPTNVLKYQNNKIVIADFGWSEHIDACNLHPNEWPGTLEINPPEVLKSTGPMGEKIDNYALGMNMILFISGRFVCRQKGVECSKVASTILKTVHNLRHSKPPSKFRENLKAWDLFLKLTSSSPIDRYSLDEVLHHPWVTEMLHKMDIHYSRFIWHEKVKTRWIGLMSNNWDFSRSISNKDNNNNNQIKTNKNVKETKSVRINKKEVREPLSPRIMKQQYDVIFNLMKSSFKNKTKGCFFKKEDATIHKIEKNEKVNKVQQKEENTVIKDTRKSDIKDIKKDEINKSNLKNTELNTSKVNENEGYSDGIHNEVTSKESSGDEDTESNTEKEDIEKEMEEESGTAGTKSEEQFLFNDNCVSKNLRNSNSCAINKDIEQNRSKINVHESIERNNGNKMNVNVDKHETNQKNISAQDIGFYLTNNANNKKLMESKKENNQSVLIKQNIGCMEKIGDTFLNFTDSKNLYIPKNVINNELLERINKLGEDKQEEYLKMKKNHLFMQDQLNEERNNNELHINLLLENSRKNKNQGKVNNVHAQNDYRKVHNMIYDNQVAKPMYMHNEEDVNTNLRIYQQNFNEKSEYYMKNNKDNRVHKEHMYQNKSQSGLNIGNKKINSEDPDSLYIRKNGEVYLIESAECNCTEDFDIEINDEELEAVIKNNIYRKDGDKEEDNSNNLYDNIIEECLKKTSNEDLAAYKDIMKYEYKRNGVNNEEIPNNKATQMYIDGCDNIVNKMFSTLLEENLNEEAFDGRNQKAMNHKNGPVQMIDPSKNTNNLHETRMIQNEEKEKDMLHMENLCNSNSSEQTLEKNCDKTDEMLNNKFLDIKERFIHGNNNKLSFNKFDIDAAGKNMQKNTKTFMEFSNECTKSYYPHSKISSSTLNSNISSDINNSIIEKFVKHTKGNQDALNNYLTELKKREVGSSFEQIRKHNFFKLNKEIFSKSKEQINEKDFAIHLKESDQQIDQNKVKSEILNNIYYNKENHGSGEYQQLLNYLISDFNNKSSIHSTMNMPKGMNGTYQQKIPNAIDIHRNKLHDFDKCEMKMNELRNQNNVNQMIPSNKERMNLIFKATSNKKCENINLNEWDDHKKRLMNDEKTEKELLDAFALQNANYYRKIMMDYKEGMNKEDLNVKRNMRNRDHQMDKNNNSLFNNKNNILHYINNINNINVNEIRYNNLINQNKLIAQNLINQKTPTAVLGKYIKENLSKTSSSSTFDCSDFDLHQCIRNDVIHPLDNTQYKLPNMERGLFPKKKNQDNKNLFN